jgi:hypothetical protein
LAFLFDTGLVRTTGFVLVLDTDFVGTTRLVVLFGTAFVGTERFSFTARFIGATNFVFGFGFAPLAGFAGATGLTFVFVARLFGQGAGTDFRCAGTGYHTAVERASLQRSLDMATDGKGGVDRRIAGTIQLVPFWHDRNSEYVLGATLAAILVLPQSVENAQTARYAAVEAIVASLQHYTANEKRRDERDSKHDERVARLLYGTATGERGLITQQNWLIAETERSLHKWMPGDSFKATVACETPLAATREAIRQNWGFLREANLQGLDLSFTQMYEADMANASLNGSRVVRTNLRCANLSDVSFGGFADSDKPYVKFANVLQTRPRSDAARLSAPFIKYAVHNEAINISDADWHTWSKNGFSSARWSSKAPIPPAIQRGDFGSFCKSWTSPFAPTRSGSSSPNARSRSRGKP